MPSPRAIRLCLVVAIGCAAVSAQGPQPPPRRTPAADASAYLPPLARLDAAATSELRDVIARYASDRAGLLRLHSAEYSAARRDVMRAFYTAWQSRLTEAPFEKLSQEGRIDYVLLRRRLEYELSLLDREGQILKETAPLLPFARTITDLQDARRRLEALDHPATAAALSRLAGEIDRTRRAVESGLRPDGAGGGSATGGDPAPIRTSRIVAFRAADMAGALKRTLASWFTYYDGYDPMFSWWAGDPYKRVVRALDDHIKTLREKVVGVREGEDEPIIGDPIGREALLADLVYEMIPYTPEELLEIANREFAWCEEQMRAASRAMGFGDDWRAALEKVKTLHVGPGRQPALIFALAQEAVDFVEKRDLVTVPPLAKDIWRMEMMTPERQKVAPFFLGGEVIQVSFPTDGMTHEQKMMSMRGNNVHFSRATVHHELIPGHHLQGFMTERYNAHRQLFGTPFWGEGWALYFEMLLWDLGFPQTPEDRVGMLFWRSHRAARIIFSLSFHLGRMTPQECIELLVNRVGHERDNATAEVRRSFNGTYPPLYQAAYMLGGLQFRSLHAQLVQSGKMTNRAFHDAILRGGRMPVEMVRARLLETPLTRDYRSQWRFAGD
jgi:hypothetical protein